MRDYTVGGLQNRLGRAVILLQSNDPGALEVFIEALDIFNFCPAPAIDRLIVVAHCRDRYIFSGQHPQPRILNSVGVLKLIDENLLKPLLVMTQNFGVFEPKLMRTQKELGKIYEPCPVTGNLIIAINLLHCSSKKIAWGSIHMGAAQAFILGAIDVPHGLLRRPASVIKLHLAAHPLDQTQLIVTIQYLKILRESCIAPVRLEQTMRQPVKGADPHPLGGDLQHILYAVTHFPGCLVSKCHRQD